MATGEGEAGLYVTSNLQASSYGALSGVTYSNCTPVWTTTTDTINYWAGQYVVNYQPLQYYYEQPVYYAYEPAHIDWTPPAPVPETDEQRAQRIASEEASRRAYEAHMDFLAAAMATQRESAERQRREIEQAKVRARELLTKHLTEEQRNDFATKSHFLVHTKRGVYRINRGIAGNIEFLGGPKDSRKEKLCIHSPHTYGLPEEDHMLGQKLLLEADEETFLRIANHYPLQ